MKHLNVNTNLQYPEHYALIGELVNSYRNTLKETSFTFAKTF